MEPLKKVHFSNILLQELNAIKVKLWAIEVEKIPNDEKVLLDSNQNLEMYWDVLFDNLPQIEPFFLRPTILDHKVDMIQWINKLASYFKGEVLGKSHSVFLPPNQTRPVILWGRSDKWYLSEEISDFDGDSYWFAIFRNLEGWQRQAQISLEEVVWEIGDQEVELLLRWSGYFKSIEQVEINGLRAKYWHVSFADELISKSDSAKATSFLINVQIGVQNGFNSFEPVDFSENKLTTSLKIPRADFGDYKKISTNFSKANVDLVVDYFINLAHPYYVKASKQLETELMEKFYRWKQETEEIDQGSTIEQRQKNLIDQLISIRQTFFGDESS